MKVLMQNRPTAFTQRGGDTVVMEKLAAGLKQLGVDVTIDVEGRFSAKDFDLVHLFNFATPELTKSMAEFAHSAGKPFVVTSLYEDIPSFHNQSIAWANLLQDYVRKGQDKNWFNSVKENYTNTQPCIRFQNDWVAQNAAAVLSCGTSETKWLKRDYPTANVQEVPFGHEVGAIVGPEFFVNAYGVRDFILCVGRAESRKNQLMLLKALEQSELPVVLVCGGVSYQPQYLQAVKEFRRNGKTLVLDRLDPEMLASCYSAAKVHCLASWFELPGLVSLEAASFGCRVVVSDTGTTRDYFKDSVYYCRPWDEESIKTAVLAAYYSPWSSAARDIATGYTWENTVKATYQSYQSIVKEQINICSTSEFDTLVAQAEQAALQKSFVKAEELLAKAESINPNVGRVLKMRGTVLLAQSKPEVAKTYFERALVCDPKDARSLSGLGMCLMMLKEERTAYHHFVKSLEHSPEHLVTIMQLIECSYKIERFDDLERVLSRYVEDHPNDMEMLFCHAGCLYRLGQIDRAGQLGSRVLASNAAHRGALQLRELIEEKAKNAPKPAEPEVNSSIRVNGSGHDLMSALADLEEQKRLRNSEYVKTECEKLLARADLTPEERERVWTLKAEATVLSGDIVEAGKIYETILQQNPQAARALCGKGAICANQRDFNTAKSFFERALTVIANYDVALSGLGLCAYYEGNVDKAWTYYQSALKTNPENTRALLGTIELGYSLNKLTDIEKALTDYLEMHPGDLDFLYALCGCLYSQGNYTGASTHLEKVLLFQPNHERGLELKAMIQDKLGISRVSANFS